MLLAEENLATVFTSLLTLKPLYLFSCISSYEIFIQTAVGSAICLIPLQIWAEQFYDILSCL